MEYLAGADPADSDPARGSAERTLATVAECCLGATLLVIPGLLFLAFLVAWPRAMSAATSVLGVAAVVAFITSGHALHRLRRRARRERLQLSPWQDQPSRERHQSSAERRRLWSRSLLCNGVVVACVVGIAGLKVGLLLCLAEIVAIVIHLIALGLPSLRA